MAANTQISLTLPTYGKDEVDSNWGHDIKTLIMEANTRTNFKFLMYA